MNIDDKLYSHPYRARASLDRCESGRPLQGQMNKGPRLFCFGALLESAGLVQSPVAIMSGFEAASSPQEALEAFEKVIREHEDRWLVRHINMTEVPIEVIMDVSSRNKERQP